MAISTTACETAAGSCGLVRGLGHLQHHDRQRFVGEFPLDPPTPSKIETHGAGVRLDDAKPERSMAAPGYLGFGLQEQSLSKTASPVFTEYPEIADPLSNRQDHPDDTCIHDGDPG